MNIEVAMQNIPSTRQQLITELLDSGVNVINPQQEHVSRHGAPGHRIIRR